MKIVITGCNGSVGRRVTLLALKRGYIVTGVDQVELPEEFQSLVQDYRERFTYHQMDLKNYDGTLDLLKSSGCEAVIHLAAFRNPTDYIVQTHNSNVVLSWNVLRACAELGITRIAQASSVNVVTMFYSIKPIFQYFPIDENHPCEPDEPYGLSKVICELQAGTITRRYSTLRIASLRLHFSVPERPYASNRKAASASKDLWGYVQQDSAADAFLLAVTCDTMKWPSKHEAFLITAPSTAVNQDSAELKKESYPDIPVRDGFEITGRRGFFDCRKAEALLGWVHRDVVPE